MRLAAPRRLCHALSGMLEGGCPLAAKLCIDLTWLQLRPGWLPHGGHATARKVVRLAAPRRPCHFRAVGLLQHPSWLLNGGHATFMNDGGWLLPGGHAMTWPAGLCEAGRCLRQCFAGWTQPQAHQSDARLTAALGSLAFGLPWAVALSSFASRLSPGWARCPSFLACTKLALGFLFLASCG